MPDKLYSEFNQLYSLSFVLHWPICGAGHIEGMLDPGYCYCSLRQGWLIFLSVCTTALVVSNITLTKKSYEQIVMKFYDGSSVVKLMCLTEFWWQSGVFLDEQLKHIMIVAACTD